MDKLNFYREIIQKILGDYSDRRSDENIESQAIFDLKRDHYQVVNVGWLNGKRVYGCVLHLDIKNGKIWLQYNGTEMGVSQMSNLFTPPPSPAQAPPLTKGRMGGVFPKWDAPH